MSRKNLPEREDLIKVYELLRQEIIQKAEQLNQLYIYAAMATGAVWAWFAVTSNSPDLPIPGLFTFGPLILAILFFMRSKKVTDEVNRLGTHLSGIENQLGFNDASLAERFKDIRVGWEPYCKASREKWKEVNTDSNTKSPLSDHPLTKWATRYWVFLCVVNRVFAIYYCLHPFIRAFFEDYFG